MLGTLAHHPELTRAYHTLNGHLLFATTLSPRQRELLILRVAAVRGCEYEWAQHVVLAADAGLAATRSTRVRDGGDGWSPLEAALLQAVDELVADARGSTTPPGPRWPRELDVPQLMDLVFTVGAYDALAMAMLSFGVELDDDLIPQEER